MGYYKIKYYLWFTIYTNISTSLTNSIGRFKINTFKTIKIMKKLVFYFFLLVSSTAMAQAPDIEWQKCLGGSGREDADYAVKVNDSSYIIAGRSWSNDGDVTGHHGTTDSLDIWVCKIDINGMLQWQKSLGGSGNELIQDLKATSDGGCIIASYTTSNDGDVSGNHGSLDIWIVKLNSSGSIEWQKCLGGSSGDNLHAILQTSDGGYIVVGLSYSNDGDVSGYHGGGDCWVVKLNSSGAIEWQKCLGGSSGDFTVWSTQNPIQQTTDGGYIIAGHTQSNDGDVSGNHGNLDTWVVKLNSSGDIQWQKCLGGSSDEHAFSVLQTDDGGYIVGSLSWSDDGDVDGHHGSTEYTDIWVVKLNSSGDIQWQNSLGGSYTEIAYCPIRQTNDGGYIIAGFSSSDDGDVTGHHGLAGPTEVGDVAGMREDMWIVKLNSSGVIEWEKSLGGSAVERAEYIEQTVDSGYIVGGHTGSNDGDVSGNNGLVDCWIVKLNSDGVIQWQKPLGGSLSESASFVLPVADDNGYIVVGKSKSNNGDVSGNHGGGDIWVVKLAGSPTGVNNIANEKSINVFPNPFDEELNIDSDVKFSSASIVDMFGRILLTTKDHYINTSALPRGVYVLKIDDKYFKHIVKN